MDRLLGLAEHPVAALNEAARALRPGGRLLVIEDFEQLAAHATDNPLAQLRAWLTAGGFTAVRLRPCDLADGHCIIAVARHGSQPGSGLQASLQGRDQIVISHSGTVRP